VRCRQFHGKSSSPLHSSSIRSRRLAIKMSVIRRFPEGAAGTADLDGPAPRPAEVCGAGKWPPERCVNAQHSAGIRLQLRGASCTSAGNARGPSDRSHLLKSPENSAPSASILACRRPGPRFSASPAGRRASRSDDVQRRKPGRAARLSPREDVDGVPFCVADERRPNRGAAFGDRSRAEFALFSRSP
jgi:hypothetical protein